MNGKLYSVNEDGTYEPITEWNGLVSFSPDTYSLKDEPMILPNEEFSATIEIDLEKTDPEVIDMIYDTNRNKLPECEVCPVQGNALACALRECQARELHNYKIMKGWHEKWIEKKCCLACAHHKCISDDRDSCDVCKKRKSKYTDCGYDLLPLNMTCDKFKAVPWEKTKVYKEYEKKGLKK